MTFPAADPYRLAAVLPVLVHIEAHLDGDLSTGRLAALAGLSEAHFSRLFARVTGETVKQYTLRVRLERAAYRLLVERSTVLRVATDCGFASHETFTRAFQRRFGTTPSAYRHTRPFGDGERRERRPGAEQRLDGYELSATRVRELHPVHVVFLRFTGPYGAVDPGAWAALQRWAAARGVPAGGRLLGVGHDAPGVTAPGRLRFDACLEVPGPVRASGRVGAQVLDGGRFAVTTHVGPFRSIGEAYDRIFARTGPVGLPAVEVYGRTVIGDLDALNSTEIRLPLASR